jgi:hypothetical protein
MCSSAGNITQAGYSCVCHSDVTRTCLLLASAADDLHVLPPTWLMRTLVAAQMQNACRGRGASAVKLARDAAHACRPACALTPCLFKRFAFCVQMLLNLIKLALPSKRCFLPADTAEPEQKEDATHESLCWARGLANATGGFIRVLVPCLVYLIGLLSACRLL